MRNSPRRWMTLAAATLLAACARSPRPATEGTASSGGSAQPATSASAAAANSAVAPADGPPSATTAAERLARSPRHGEWATVRVGTNDSVRAWVVYPERSTKAPVVILVHDITGMGNWIRSMADQAAADGFIAIAPDLLTGKAVERAGDSVIAAGARAAIGALDATQVQQRLSAVAEYGMSLPAATRRYGITGFCWGGGITFAHAAAAPGLGAAVPFYGPVSAAVRAGLERAKAPVLGIYAENDARVNATIPAADSALATAGVRFEKEMYTGAGHGFTRQQDGPAAQPGANREAARRAWPRTVAWFRQHLESAP